MEFSKCRCCKELVPHDEIVAGLCDECQFGAEQESTRRREDKLIRRREKRKFKERYER